MKRRLNILCILVIAVLCFSLFDTGSQVLTGIEVGTRVGASQDKEKLEKVINMQPVALLPLDMGNIKDSVLNSKTGEYVPAIYYQLIVSIKTHLTEGQKNIYFLSYILNMVFLAASVLFFVRIIISINKSNIFNWKNVSRLRWLSVSLIMAFITSVVPFVITNRAVSEVFAMDGYRIGYTEYISVITLVLGLACLIVGEIFAIGLKMQEEQELTI